MIDGMPGISVHFLPALTTADELAGGVVVVIDVLRATTTITTALAAGAREIFPCLEIEDARRKAAELGKQTPALLGGERHGKPIEGFNLGSSPREYTPQTVGDRTIVFTTTNGTKAMQICGKARQVLVGAFVNLSAVAKVVKSGLPIHLLCAGTDGQVTREDVLFAGAVADRLTSSQPDEFELNDQARIARDAWRQVLLSGKQLALTLRDTHGGHNLISLGMDQDIADAAQIDRYDFVPVLDTKQWRITKPEIDNK